MVFFWCICYSSSYKYRCLVGRRDADLFPLWKSHHAHRHIVGRFTFSFKVSDLHFVNCTLYPELPGLAPWESGYMLKSTPLPLGTTICPQKLTITLEKAFQAGGICSCTTESGVGTHSWIQGKWSKSAVNLLAHLLHCASEQKEAL